MFVNISRSKFLINGARGPRKRKKSAPAERCKHCGGAFRNNGEFANCIMCSREIGHVCVNCTHASTVDVEKTKKSA